MPRQMEGKHNVSQMSGIIFAGRAVKSYLCTQKTKMRKMMRKVGCMGILALLSLPVPAQKEGEAGQQAGQVTLKEVTVEAAKVIRKVDGQLAERRAGRQGGNALLGSETGEKHRFHR